MYDMKPYLKRIDEVIKKGPYKDTWESLSQYQAPDWYQKKKFGIFIHWGVYSVPAFGSEWYSRNMYIQGSPEYEHHIKTYGKHSEFGYKDFIPMFKAEKFDPDAWASLFEEAGAQYVVPVAEHHDGFQMYKSEISHWNAYEMGPKRDVLGELGRSCNQKGMRMGASTHRIEHWFFMSHGKEFESDIKEPMERGDFYWPAMKEADHHDINSEPTPTKEFLEDWLVRTCEIIDRYHPQILYFDWWIQHESVKPYLMKFAAYYYNRGLEWNMEVGISYKHDAMMLGTGILDMERGHFSEAKPFYWQADTSMAFNSWCYTEQNRFKTTKDILQDLVDIVSKNGCLLLNVGPKADGTICEEEVKILEEIGEWMDVNGEAIYDSHPWRVQAEGETEVVEGMFSEEGRKDFDSKDVRFTCKADCIYIIPMQQHGEDVIVKSMGEDSKDFHGIITEFSVLGYDQKPEFTREADHSCTFCRQ